MYWSQYCSQYDPAQEDVEDLCGSFLYPRLDLEHSSSEHDIHLVDDRNMDGFLRGRLVSDEVDYHLLTGWILRCSREHGQACHPQRFEPTEYLSLARHFTAIDISDL